MPKVSVIITTYNRANLLNRALQSVFNQTFQDFEIIVVDDASTDGTEKLVKGFNDKRIIYLKHDQNKGVSIARNTGIKHASGEYIGYLDSDDEWLPEKLEKQIKVFCNAHKTLGLVYTIFQKQDYKKELYISKYRGNVISHILSNNFVGTASTPLIRKECFNKVGFFDKTLHFGEDWDMWIRIAQYYEFEYVNKVLVKYFPQVTSLSTDTKAIIDGRKRLFVKYEKYIKTYPKKVQAARFFYFGMEYYWLKDFRCFKYFAQSILMTASIIPTIIDFLFVRQFRKFGLTWPCKKAEV